MLLTSSSWMMHTNTTPSFFLLNSRWLDIPVKRHPDRKQLFRPGQEQNLAQNVPQRKRQRRFERSSERIAGCDTQQSSNRNGRGRQKRFSKANTNNIIFAPHFPSPIEENQKTNLFSPTTTKIARTAPLAQTTTIS